MTTEQDAPARMVFKAEKIRAGDLEPGDLFSSAGPAYWDHAGADGIVGERLYVRTDEPAMSPGHEAEEAYRVTLELGPPKIRADLDDLLRAAKRVEWGGYTSNPLGGFLPACPDCSGRKDSGHREDCFLRAALDQAEAPDEPI